MRIGGEEGVDRAPLAGDDLADREAAARILDGRGERTGERDGAVPHKELIPTVDGAGNAHREDAGSRHQRALGEASTKCCDRGPAGRAAARVERVHGAAVVNQRKQVTADAGHRRFDDREGCGGGDGGVHRVAALHQHLEARRRGERLGRRDDAVTGQHDGPRGARARGPSLAGTPH